MTPKRRKNILRYAVLLTFVALLIVGCLLCVDRVADGMWPWESAPEVLQ